MRPVPPSGTALVVIDPYNDFTSRLGKGWPLIREVANDVKLIDHLKQAIAAARLCGIPVVYAPHLRYRRGQDQSARFPNPTQFLTRLMPFFAEGRRGGRFRTDLAPQPGDFVASEHPLSSGFTDTNLDEHLRSIGATHLVMCGLLTNTCVESTARAAVDLGYRVSVLEDAVAAWSYADHEAALCGSLRQVVHDVIPTKSFVAAVR